ncbi:hypothetical protein N0V83_009566 [Neocucurbitaria cava]|uniref:Uncharacterized protein n=1 Tax=Neocucurbitaria cava TaxID=798079 RepID=A0A9W9CIE6_9PLEO|nr:hypothetical protein N0V83_009566 [Neocucurbitaria cava]
MESIAPTLATTTLDRLTKEVIEETGQAYASMDVDETLQLDLPSAVAIVKRLQVLEALDFKHYLLGSQRFTPSTVHHRSHFIKAACSADSFIIRGLEVYFNISLSLLPGQTRSISIGELEKEMQSKLVSRGQHADGIKVVFERMEEVLRKVIGILVWWHREQCKMNGKTDQS